MSEQAHLKKSLSPLMLWALGVGYVISGMYFGWNLGLEKAGSLGMAVATAAAALLYVCFTFSYAELSCAIPRAGGAYDYALKSLGPDLALIAGLAQWVEFVFAPPAIAFAIGAYFNLFFPEIPALPVAMLAYLLFTLLNSYGVKAAANFELIVTVLAVGELLLFAGITLPHFQPENLSRNALPHGWSGLWAAVPFAIWFFLGIEGVANVAEETANPQRDIIRGFGSALLSLLFLCALTFVAAVGVAGWEAIVYQPGSGTASDSPLPLAMAHVVGNNSLLYHLLITIGLFGLVASFHGLLLAAGRATFEFGRSGLAPAWVGKVKAGRGTPVNALWLNMGIGMLVLLSGHTAEIITLSVFGALSMYALSMLAHIQLRRLQPGLHRPFRVPGFPYVPGIALLLSVLALLAMIRYNAMLAVCYFGLLSAAFIIYKLSGKKIH